MTPQEIKEFYYPLLESLDADDAMLPDCIAAKIAAPHAPNERVCFGVALIEGVGSGSRIL